MPFLDPSLSRTERIIIELLIKHGESFGSQLIKRSRGKLLRGSVYVYLSRMEDKELISSRRRGLPRRLYRHTPRGLRVLEAVQLAEAHLRA